MIDNRTKSIPTSSSEVGIYYVYISQGNKDNGVYIVSDFVLPITVTKIAELYIGDNTKANLTGGNTFTGDQIINGDITVEDITATNFLGNASTATKLKTFVNINGVAFDGSSNITIYDGTKEATITPGNTSQYFRGDKTWQTLNKIVVGLSNVDNTADANKNVLSATKLTIPRTINNVTFDGSENIVINAIDITPRIPISYMGIANGVATLDSNGIIPITQLPSYVDDVIEVANYASLPIIGESGKIYVTTNNNKTYRWSGSVYVYITSGAVDSVNGYTGVVVLTKSDFILGNVDNTSDANKPISIVTQGALDLKQNLLTLGNFTSTTPGITISNGNGAVIGSGITFNITTAGATTGGLITSGHWNTFNNKWDSSNHPITTLGYGLPDYPTTLPASDVYSWAKQSTKPTYSYSEITSKPTLLSQFANDLGNYGGWITGINSGMVTTALGYTPLPTRTFGTAANNNTSDFYLTGSTVANSTKWNGHSLAGSEVPQMHFPLVYSSTLGAWGYGVASQFQSWLGLGSSAYTNTNDHILNQNASAQSANMWISGEATIGLNKFYKSGSVNLIKADNSNNIQIGDTSVGGAVYIYNGYSTPAVTIQGSGRAATFASTVNATQFGATGSNAFNGYNEGWLNLYSSDNSHRLRINNSTTYNRIDFYDQTLDRYADIKANVGEFTGQIKSTVATGTAPLTVNSTTMVGNLTSQYLGGNNYTSPDLNTLSSLGRFSVMQVMRTSANIFPYTSNANAVITIDTFDGSETYKQQLGFNGSGEIYSRYGNNSWSKLYHSGNLTNALSTNYIPKWNGSSMVNSLIVDDANTVYINKSNAGNLVIPLYLGNNSTPTTNSAVGIELNARGVSGIGSNSTQLLNIRDDAGGNHRFVIKHDQFGEAFVVRAVTGNIEIKSTTPSTSPTTGALVVNGGIGANHIFSNSYNLSNACNNWSVVQGNSDNHFAIIDNQCAERLRIFGNGNVGIGYTTDQGYKLAVNGNCYFGNSGGVGRIYIDGSQSNKKTYSLANGISAISNTGFEIRNETNGTSPFYIDGSDNAHFSGTVTASNFILSSDRTLKTNIQSITKDYSRLNLVSFNFKDNLNELRFGTIAQDLLSNGYSEFVTGDKEGEYKVKYIDLIIAKLASAELRIKELEDKYGSR